MSDKLKVDLNVYLKTTNGKILKIIMAIYLLLQIKYSYTNNINFKGGYTYIDGKMKSGKLSIYLVNWKKFDQIILEIETSF